MPPPFLPICKDVFIPNEESSVYWFSLSSPRRRKRVEVIYCVRNQTLSLQKTFASLIYCPGSLCQPGSWTSLPHTHTLKAGTGTWWRLMSPAVSSDACHLRQKSILDFKVFLGCREERLGLNMLPTLEVSFPLTLLCLFLLFPSLSPHLDPRSNMTMAQAHQPTFSLLPSSKLRGRGNSIFSTHFSYSPRREAVGEERKGVVRNSMFCIQPL